MCLQCLTCLHGIPIFQAIQDGAVLLLGVLKRGVQRAAQVEKVVRSDGKDCLQQQ